jgi:Fe-S cluster biosynthesis and repair protein YggX
MGKNANHVCTICKKEKEGKEFPLYPSNKMRRQTKCNECLKIYKKCAICEKSSLLNENNLCNGCNKVFNIKNCLICKQPIYMPANAYSKSKCDKCLGKSVISVDVEALAREALLPPKNS